MKLDDAYYKRLKNKVVALSLATAISDREDQIIAILKRIAYDAREEQAGMDRDKLKSISECGDNCPGLIEKALAALDRAKGE